MPVPRCNSPNDNLVINAERVRPGVLQMLNVCLGVTKGESVLVLTDVPTRREWQRNGTPTLADALRRCVLAKVVSEIAALELPGCEVSFLPFPSTGKSGAELSKTVASRMKQADVVIALTTHSLSHTTARSEARKAGARVASMPGFLAEMFYAGDVLDVDYTVIDTESRRIADALSKADHALVTSKGGTNLSFSLAGREGLAGGSTLTERGSGGNLPVGEACIAPLEGTGSGSLVVEKGWFPGSEDMLLIFQEGKVVEVRGGGDFGQSVREQLGLGPGQKPHKSRRNLAELGIGTNPKATRALVLLEAEKIKGTVHIAIGDNAAGLGGTVSSDLHWDFVVPQPDLILDGIQVLRDGRLLI